MEMKIIQALVVSILREVCLAMRTRKLLLCITTVLTINVTLYLVFKPFPTIGKLMEQTNKKIHYIRNLNTRELTVDDSYLEYLGFYDEKNVLTTSASETKVVVGSAVSSSDYEDSYALITSVRRYRPNSEVVLFDIGLRSWHANQLKKHCNASVRCRVKGFEFQKFPAHVGNTGTKAYKPLAIQMLLHEYQGVIWTDLSSPPYYFVTDELDGLLARARRVGLLGWSIPSPTSSLTHARMFAYLKAKPEDYYFHRMVASAHLIVFNTPLIRNQVMLPWVKCTLSVECLSPIGAQRVGCNFARQPYFRYSGCHWYEMSALNIILGQVFRFNVSAYTCNQKVFGYSSNDTDISNHFKISGLDFDKWRINLLSYS